MKTFLLTGFLMFFVSPIVLLAILCSTIVVSYMSLIESVLDFKIEPIKLIPKRIDKAMDGIMDGINYYG